MQMALVAVLPVFALLTASLVRVPEKSDLSASHRLSKSVLVGAYSLILLAVLLAALPSLGWAPATESALLTTLVYGVLSGLVMVGLLQLRSRRLAQGHDRLQTELTLLERQAQQERDFRQDQQKTMSMLGHELKSPLAVVSMLVTTPEALTPQKTALIKSSVGDMNNVIERTLLSGALEGKRLSVQQASCDVAAEIQRLCKQSPQAARLQLHLDVQESVESDPHMLSLVLSNLIDNACRHSAPESIVSISLSSQMRGDLPGLQVMVSNLPGRSAWPDPDRIFQKFYRHEHARHQTGAGLGLYVSRGLAHLLDGQLDYRPSPSHIRFALWLPL
jgi:signal transduction histidine kinase